MNKPLGGHAAPGRHGGRERPARQGAPATAGSVYHRAAPGQRLGDGACAASPDRRSVLRIVPADALQSPHLRTLLGWYRSAAEGEDWPSRSAFRPELLAPATLPHIGLVDVEPRPFRVLYRLVGAAIGEGMGGRGLRMRYLDETDLPQRDELEVLWRRAYAAAAPLFLRGRQAVGDSGFVLECCALPVGSRDDPVRRYLIGEDYLEGDVAPAIRAHRRYRLPG